MEVGFAKDINCFSGTNLVGWASSTVGYFINFIYTARKIAFMKAYLSLVNSATLFFRSRTLPSADLM